MQPFLGHPPCWCSLFHFFIQCLSFQFQMFHTGNIWSQARVSLIRHLSVINYPPTYQWPLTLTPSTNEALVSTWTDNSKVVMREQVCWTVSWVGGQSTECQDLRITLYTRWCIFTSATVRRAASLNWLQLWDTQHVGGVGGLTCWGARGVQRTMCCLLL